MLRDYFNDFIHLFLPQVCLSCDESLLAHEDVLCTACIFHLPWTDFHVDRENETAKQLWGKLDFEVAVSMLYLAQSSRVESLLYKLKYGKQPRIGVFLGQYYAAKLKRIGLLENIDLIVPVPVHNSKLRVRGYNQSSKFAEGLAIGSNIPWSDQVLIRKIASVSQTKKRRAERYDNVENVFELKDKKAVEGKRLLLVDDVLTTGATICAAGNVLVKGGALVSVATIARA